LRYSKILDETIKNIVPSSRERMVEKEKELNSLLKTPKGLGKLEELAMQLEGIKKDYRPEKKIVIVMAADNGVEREKVSKSKRIITQYVVEAMLQGKSSINALGKTFGADIEVVDLGIDETTDLEGKINLAGIINRKLMQTGTHNIAEGPAMDYITAVKAIETGIEIADVFAEKGYNLFAAGEMGIGNTTTSSAVLKVLTDLPLDDITGYGSGIDEKTLEHKKNVIQRAIDVNNGKEGIDTSDIIDVLSKVGGLDIAGMAGIYLGCAKNSIPVVIDGFISSVAALCAYRLCENVKDYMLPSHMSEESGMKYIIEELGMEPFLFMNMKLGEGTGAVMMFPVIEAACNISSTVRKYPEV